MIKAFCGCIVCCILAGFVFAGCATRVIELPNGTIVRDKVPLAQVGVVKGFQNNCAPRLEIWNAYGRMVGNLAYGRFASLPLESRAFSGSSREVYALIKAFADVDGQVFVGSREVREWVDTYNGTREAGTIQIDRLDSPQGVRCPSQVR